MLVIVSLLLGILARYSDPAPFNVSSFTLGFVIAGAVWVFILRDLRGRK